MRSKKLAIMAFALLGLAACDGATDLERGLGGAAFGAIGSSLVGGNAATGAVLGGVAGVLCDEVTPDLCE